MSEKFQNVLDKLRALKNQTLNLNIARGECVETRKQISKDYSELETEIFEITRELEAQGGGIRVLLAEVRKQEIEIEKLKKR